MVIIGTLDGIIIVEVTSKMALIIIMILTEYAF